MLEAKLASNKEVRRMRGRKPDPLTLAPADGPVLAGIARRGALPWYQVRSARIVLAIAAGERRRCVAERMQCAEATVWRTCQRYEESGLAGLLADHRSGHSGRPLGISPPPTGANRRPRLSRTPRPRVAPHPLDQ
jgi:Homeodomain-like domain-containing protein